MTMITDLNAEHAIYKRSLANLLTAWEGLEAHDAGNFELRQFLTHHINETREEISTIQRRLNELNGIVDYDAECPF